MSQYRSSEIFQSMIDEEQQQAKQLKTDTSDLNISKIEPKHSHFINVNSSNPVQMDKKAKYVQKEYYNYLADTGIKTAFEIVFNEIVANKIEPDEVFAFTANRLREIGQKLKEVDTL